MTPWEKKDQLVNEVVSLARQDKAAQENGDFIRFVDVFFKTSAPDDVIEQRPEALLAKARYIWAAAAQRKPGKPIIKIFNTKKAKHGWHSNHSSILIINDDMPFIVDSITGLLSAKRRMQIYCLDHPIMVVERSPDGTRQKTVGPVHFDDPKKKPAGRESYLYIEVESTTDKTEIKTLEAEIAAVLDDIRDTVADWKPMLAKIDETVASLTVNPPPIEEENVDETIRFLRWLGNNRFTFIGFREYRFDGDAATSQFRTVDDSGYGILRDPDRHILRGADGLTAISPEIRYFLTLPDQPVIITKANVKSTIHRPIHLDYIGVKIYDRRRNVVGERRFVGLFTSAAYAESALDTPLLRQKVRDVQVRSSFDTRSHAGKALTHIIETFPRDELFQISADRLLSTTLGILHLMERPKPFAFIRRDKFERFVSVLVYVPRDNYQSGLRVRIADVLCEAFNGEISVYYAQLSEDVIARWHFIIRTKPGQVPKVDEAAINARIAEVAADWALGLKEDLIARLGEEQGLRLFRKYEASFSVAYRDAFLPSDAVFDVIRLDRLPQIGPVDFDAYRMAGDPNYSVRLKLYTESGLVPLSRCLPMLENLGFTVISENAYEVRGGHDNCIHDFYLERADRQPFDLAEEEEDRLVDLLIQVWAKRVEDGAFNGLCVVAQMTWRHINVVRAYARYLRQIGLPFGQRYMARSLSQNADITRLLFTMFEAKFDPKGGKGKKREALVGQIKEEILRRLDGVASLDQDRILRNFLNVICATLRTNFYQDYDAELEPGLRGSLALKIRTQDVEEAPRPRLYAEIFVYSPRLEGVHLRGGPVARGGLRWSDREEDFRTEVLGLVKAQQVKNVVIVPVGAKGGFVPKELPPPGDRDAYMAEGIACYKSFISTLLSVTDNLKDGKVIPPLKTVRHDGDDPYLVVAADKGTATFSDISNGLAQDRGFWLGDAFASGGSVGYDHKKMGITARGAWVSVQRLYREMGKNTQKDPISVIGVGDMSGDVFGNGMLLSKTIRLLAAFNHMHIFIDPNPEDPVKSWKERKRLFDMPRSSWADYDTRLISAGGGVFERSVKSIKLSPQIKEAFAIVEDALAPHDLINRILKAPADLLWFGGIGTYVKASSETHVEAGDRANDTLRVNADQLRVKMIGEGGNLGMTQRARIEFARHGGRLNTDFIDNAGGVNSSDKEVNIKILLSDAMASGALKPEDRETLLADMTDEVADIVLRDNYLQVQAISHAEAMAQKRRESHAGLIRTLEREGLLDREIEFLPTEEQFSEMALNQQGLTRPEISTLMSYAKMSLKAILAQSDVMDDDYLAPELRYSFPKRLGETFGEALSQHRLRRELVATTLANMLANRGGLTFVYDVREETGLGIDQIASAFLIARDIFDLERIWQDIDALDYKVPATIQSLMHLEVAEFLKRQTIWFLRAAPKPLAMKALVDQYRDDVHSLMSDPKSILSPTTMEEYGSRVAMLTEQKVPRALATRVAALEVLQLACDIVRISRKLDIPAEEAGKAFYEVGFRLGFDWLNQTSNMLVADDHWEMLAARSILDDLADQQRELTYRILSERENKDACAAVAGWVAGQEMTMLRIDRLLGDLKSSGPLSVAKLSFAARHIRSILSRIE